MRRDFVIVNLRRINIFIHIDWYSNQNVAFLLLLCIIITLSILPTYNNLGNESQNSQVKNLKVGERHKVKSRERSKLEKPVIWQPVRENGWVSKFRFCKSS